jgi:biopolymer transport protein TolQ
MATNPSILHFLLDASLVVKLVLLILILASIASWTLIFQRVALFKRTQKAMRTFEKAFHASHDIDALYKTFKRHNGMAAVFIAGIDAFRKLSQAPHITPTALLEGTARAMRIAQTRELEALEDQLSLLATVGSTSPYVGLFGTVWGIMTSFQSLGGVQQATIAMVAPGISEALIATAVGLFAAIPAVIAYNRFSTQLTKLEDQYDTFSEELSNLLQREAYS